MAATCHPPVFDFAPGTIVLPNDNELISRYLKENDQSSFEQLVHRHASMVMSVCRNMLLNQQDAEDAFQATFLIFSRKMNRLLGRGSVGGWLYQTAIRNCLQTRRLKGRKRETAMTEDLPTQSDEPWLSISNAQESDLIHSEINRLPERYRDVIVLCHLEGFSRSQAAEFLDCTESSVKAALARGRNLLRRRLVKRGLIVGTLLTTLTANTVHANQVMPADLIESTVRLCLPQSTPDSLPPTVAQLANTGTQAMTTASVLKVTCYALVAGLILSIPLVSAARSQFNNSPAAIVIANQDNAEQEDDQDIKIVSEGVDLGSSATPNTVAVINQQVGDESENQKDKRKDFSAENSRTYWELKIQALRSRSEYFKSMSSMAGKQHEQLRFASEYYDTLAELHVAELQMERISQEEQLENQSKDDFGETPRMSFSESPQSAQTSRTTSESQQVQQTAGATGIPPGVKAKLVPGEVLLIEHADQTLRRRCVIAADYTIRIPFAGTLDLKGKSILEAEKLIQNEFASWYKDSSLIFVARESSSRPQAASK